MKKCAQSINTKDYLSCSIINAKFWQFWTQSPRTSCIVCVAWPNPARQKLQGRKTHIWLLSWWSRIVHSDLQYASKKSYSTHVIFENLLGECFFRSFSYNKSSCVQIKWLDMIMGILQAYASSRVYHRTIHHHNLIVISIVFMVNHIYMHILFVPCIFQTYIVQNLHYPLEQVLQVWLALMPRGFTK
jgi:hypothetical protein